MNPHLLLKLLHVMAVIAFLGNIATGLFWHAHAARTRDARQLAHATDGIIRSDRIFTVPGLVFMFRVAPLQRQLRARAAAAVESGTFEYAQYRALAVRWELWGAAALLTPMAGLVLIVLKPGL